MADISIKHLVKRFGRVEAVSDVSLQIADGEIQKSAFGQDTLDSVCNSRNEMGLQANVT